MERYNFFTYGLSCIFVLISLSLIYLIYNALKTKNINYITKPGYSDKKVISKDKNPEAYYLALTFSVLLALGSLFAAYIVVQMSL